MAPNNPGTSPNIPVESTGPQINEIVRDHKIKLRKWQETTRTYQALQQHLITAFDEQYLRGLRNMHTEYVGVTTFQMLTHLYEGSSHQPRIPPHLEDRIIPRSLSRLGRKTGPG